jgi:flagellar biosynthetic protein FliR
MTQFVHYAIPQFQSLMVIAVRVGGIMAAMPVLASRSIPHQMKAALIVMIGLVLLPMVNVPRLPEDPMLIGAGLGAEFLVGMVIGLGVRVLFAAFQVAGDLMGTQMGLSVVQLLDPGSSQQTAVISQFYTLVATLVFLSMNAHFLVVEAIAKSFEFVPPFGASLAPELGEDVARISQGMFMIALKLAAPVLTTALLINLAMAILGRTVSQLNVFVMSFPLTIIGGFLVMGAAMPFIVGLSREEFQRLEVTILGLLRSLGHG